MARTLSTITRPAVHFAVMGGVTLVAAASLAEDAVHVSPAPAVIENPFSGDSRPPVKTPPQAVEPVQRPAGVYRNPFAPGSGTPPIAIQPLPGPVSRWQRSMPLLDEQSPVRTAILTADPAREFDISWGEVPTLETMRDRATSAKLGAGSAFRRPIVPPDPVQFAPTPLAQPVWLETDRLPTTTAPAIGQATFDEEIASDRPEPWSSGPGQTERSNNDLSPIVIADFDESAEGWLTRAQQAAGRAASLEELATITQLCERGLAAEPDADISDSLRRLAAWAHNRRGELLAEDDRQRQAIEEFQLAIALDPRCALAFHNRAVTLAEQNDHLAALRDFNRVIELNPGLAVAYRNRAELFTVLGRMSEAAGDYTRAIESLPDDATLYAARGYAWQRLGNFDRATADMDRALEIAPDAPDALTQRGNLWAEAGDYDRALADFERAITSDPNCVEAYRSVAWLRATCSSERYRDAAEALKAANTAAELSEPGDFLVLEAQAAANAAAGQFEPATQLQQRACDSAPVELVDAARQRLAIYRSGRAFLSDTRSPAEPAEFLDSPSARPSPRVRSR